MYAIYADDVCIYSDVFPLDDMNVVNPKLVMADCVAGSLVMTLPPSNKGYNTITRLTTDIRVDKDGKELWSGRVLAESKDFWNNRILVCEGELAYFNDSTQPPKEYVGLSIRAFISELIAIHNAKVPPNRQFIVGAITVEDNDFPTRYTNYETTIELLNGLVERYGGHLRIRKQDGVRYVDYLKDYPDTCSQLIQFGSNLIDFSRNWDSSEFATAIVPLGNRLNNSPIEALDAYLTVESVNDGSIYVQSEEAVAAYGWIEKTVSWDDVTDPALLLDKAKFYLSDLQFDNMELQLSALDLHYLDVNTETVKLLDEIQVISRPHGLNRLFPVTRLEIPLDNPEQTQFILGDTVKTSLTSTNNQISAAILQKIESLPKAHSILKEARENATQIMNMATTGYITITKDEYGSDTLYISNIRDYAKADKLWKWNMNGLGYSKDGGKTFGLAITMDGSIVADYITTGVLNADVIRAGTLKDYGENFMLDFETGKLTIKKGSIDIGGGNFTVDEDGNLYARRGTFAGKLVAASGTFAGELHAAKIYGDLVADPADGGFLRGCGISVGGDNWENGRGNFYVDKDGNVTMAGSIKMDGNITWSTSNSPCQVLYAQSPYVTPSGSYNNYPSSSSSGWHKSFNVEADYYASYTYDGGLSWTSSVKIRGSDGLNGSDASVTRDNIWRALLNSLPQDGLYSGVDPDTGDQALLIRASAIKTGILDAESVYLSSKNGFGGFCVAQGDTDIGYTKGAKMYGGNGPNALPYIIVTDAGIRLQERNDVRFYLTAGGIYASEELTIGSDYRIKNSVDCNLDGYENFFMALKPVRYRLNYGTSGRYHTGFIAQDVETAMQKNGLSGDDFAGLVIENIADGVSVNGIRDRYYRLRYGEFIALNTYMIQRTWNEIARLNAELRKIQTRGEHENAS